MNQLDQWILTDTKNNIWHENKEIREGHVGFRKTTLSGGRRHGVEQIELFCNGQTLVVLPTRGMSLHRFHFKNQNDHRTTELGWQSPVDGPVHPEHVPLSEPSGLGWLEGFDELLVRCGLISNGAPEFDDQGRLKYALHGRIANLPADFVSVEVDSKNGIVAITGQVFETRFLFHRLRLTVRYELSIEQPGIRVIDRVENLAERDQEIQLLYHWNFGQPLLENGSKVFLPIQCLAPRDDRAAEGLKAWNEYGAPESGFSEQVYFAELVEDENGKSLALLTNGSQNLAVELEFSRQQLPYFIVWKNTGALADGYVTGLEPSTNFPNTTSFEQSHNRTVSLQSGEAFESTMHLRPIDCRASESNAIETAKNRIERIQAVGFKTATILDKPRPDWSE